MHNLESSNRLQQVNLRQQLLCKRIQILTNLGGGPAASHHVISKTDFPPEYCKIFSQAGRGEQFYKLQCPISTSQSAASDSLCLSIELERTISNQPADHNRSVQDESCCVNASKF